jgi:hypothetical protein
MLCLVVQQLLVLSIRVLVMLMMLNEQINIYTLQQNIRCVFAVVVELDDAITVVDDDSWEQLCCYIKYTHNSLMAVVDLVAVMDYYYYHHHQLIQPNYPTQKHKH